MCVCEVTERSVLIIGSTKEFHDSKKHLPRTSTTRHSNAAKPRRAISKGHDSSSIHSPSSGISVPLPTGLTAHPLRGPFDFGDKAFARCFIYRMHNYSNMVEPEKSFSKPQLRPQIRMTGSNKSHNLTARYRNGNMHPNDPNRDLFGGSDTQATFQHTCLFTALSCLGEDVRPTQSGPFRALAHGNPVLESRGKALVPCDPGSLTPGSYVVWTPQDLDTCGFGHFIAVVIIDDSCQVYNNGQRTTRNGQTPRKQHAQRNIQHTTHNTQHTTTSNQQ